MNGKLTQRRAAEQLNALGNETRLKLFRLLVRAGPDGLNIGQIQRHMKLPASTLAHHINGLARADLIDQERQGREIISTARFEAVRRLGTYLLEDCCRGVCSAAEGTAA